MAGESIKLHLPEGVDKTAVFERVGAWLGALSFEVADVDNQRPWGGYFVVGNASTPDFIGTFFSELDNAEVYKHGTQLRPKILLVEPAQRLSWQYHNRRAELWKVVMGPVGVATSQDDVEPEAHGVLLTGDFVQHENQVRHRLIGLGHWGVIAEIWQHTQEGHLSNEADVIRVTDSYGRDKYAS